jgi:hypothetical protein
MNNINEALKQSLKQMLKKSGNIDSFTHILLTLHYLDDNARHEKPLVDPKLILK